MHQKLIPALTAISLILCQSELATAADETVVEVPRHPPARKSAPKDSSMQLVQPAAPNASVAQNRTAKPRCGEVVVTALLASGSEPISLTCSIRLSSANVITHPLVFEGSGASGSLLDCNGATLDVSAGRSRKEKTAIVVRSRRTGSGTWDAPSGVTVRNCKIKGFVRVYGLGENANGEAMRLSSHNAHHTAFAQASAPKDVRVENVAFDAPGGIPFYVGPGVTGAALVDTRIGGTSTSVAVYLDAESANNNISNNLFTIATEKRELIAIDGSARNRITNNVFGQAENGGIYLYRNCGEGGVIRHQEPQYNQIIGNTFRYRSLYFLKPAVWLNSRNGKRNYCFKDPAFPFGSSASNLDLARHNVVRGNKLQGGPRDLIRNDDPTNDIGGNVAIVGR
ncbi:right-handed parallel beta-helix repeat-containing protein [Sinorhizobium garamanticum]|uniref:Right-handed parallel beta-helix repeat-containing protein n=1 Tax=Sinorhizobium garamanticum TaxID=680247 RepID=A0ABY8DJ10_9HYPH|nr:right-handed parallel beta-helix repeat-containing protein [Sinorhizobium garamanticum]WEX90900.1 right-handed parallel beta-helix repeat-containing protein [Sinorhizobium garamanticum]